MSELKIATRDNKTRFKPGERLHGVAGWSLPGPPQSVEVRLFWFTRGRGTVDVGLIATRAFETPMGEEARPFEFDLPTAPHSFSGKLISVLWAVEVVALPSQESARFEFTLGPDGAEIVLPGTEDTEDEDENAEQEDRMRGSGRGK